MEGSVGGRSDDGKNEWEETRVLEDMTESKGRSDGDDGMMEG